MIEEAIITTRRKQMSDSNRSRRHQRKSTDHKKNKKRQLPFLIKSLIIIILFSVIGAATYGAKLLADANNALDSAYKPRKKVSTMNGKKLNNLNDNIDPLKDPISILVMGIDDDEERALGSARTDTMMLLTINPKTEIISMVSIPRDTFTQINTDAFTGKDKICIAYTYGGDEAAIQAVQDLMNVPINYYLTVDFISFEKVIDALGGVEIDVPFDIHQHYASENYTDGPVIIHKGKQVLNGENALVYARMRKVDTDIERGKRGQEVVQQAVKKASDVGSISKYNDVIQAIDGHFWTDMPKDTMMAIAQSGLKKNYKFENYTFSWMSFDYFIHGMNMNMVGLHEDSLDYISHKMRLSLGLDEPDERDQGNFEFVSNQIVSPKTSPDEGIKSSDGQEETIYHVDSYDY